MSGPADRLDGLRVLVTRPPFAWRDLAARFEARGAVVEFRAPIERVPCAPDASVVAALDRLGGGDWVVFTSPAAVDLVDDAARRSGRPGLRSPARLAAVGPGTARAITDRGLACSLTAESARGSGLVEALLARGGAIGRVLWPRPETAASDLGAALAARGIVVDEIVLYRTVASPEARTIAADIAAGRYRAVVLTSPSTLAAVLDADPAHRDAVRAGLAASLRIALGPTTAAALESAGLAPHGIARSPTAEEIGAVLEAAFGR